MTNQRGLFDTEIPEWQGGPPASSRFGKQCAAILALLKIRPRTGSELILVAHRFGARIYDLRKAGHRIEKRQVGDGEFLYSLEGEG